MKHPNSQVKMSDVIECQLACEASFTDRDFERATAGTQFAGCHPLIYVCGQLETTSFRALCVIIEYSSAIV